MDYFHCIIYNVSNLVKYMLAPAYLTLILMSYSIYSFSISQPFIISLCKEVATSPGLPHLCSGTRVVK